MTHVHIWNRLYDQGANGVWEDITTTSKDIFDFDDKYQQLSVRGLDLDVWVGQVVKFSFANVPEQYAGCALAKFQGKILYPVDVREFKEKLHPRPTAVVTTQSARTTNTPRTTKASGFHFLMNFLLKMNVEISE